MEVSTIGIDLAKHVFQVHGVDKEGTVVVRRRLSRGKVLAFFGKLSPCLIGIEACASAHHWARELSAQGHEVRLMPPSYVKPYVRRSKTDAADAAAICEAVRRPSMRFVAVKTADQQAVLVLHRSRDLLVRQRTMVINALRAHCAEFGVIAAQGRAGVTRLLRALDAGELSEAVPELARGALSVLAAQLHEVEARIAAIEREIRAWHRANPASRRLATIPGIGPLTASALVATVGDVRQFRSGRELAAWLGLVPRQTSTGGKTRLGAISKQGDRYLRRLLVIGATAVLRHPGVRARAGGPWLEALMRRRPARLATVALANKMARIAWALLAREETYRPRHARAAA